MKLKKLNPITPSQRNLIRLNKSMLLRKSLLKKDILGITNVAGRNNTGKITSFHKGGGHKKKYRKIEFLRNKNSTGIVCSIEHDPYRNSNIASVYDFLEKTYYYILQPNNLNVGDIIKSGDNAEPQIGHALQISKVPVGSFIHNISLKANKKSQISRSAGTSSLLIEKTATGGQIKLTSGKIISLANQCTATIGVVSNGLTYLTNVGKAGRSRWLNNRPKVRGVAMNPIDHPHGGGEGKTSGGRKTSVTPWGKPVRKGSTSTSKKRNHSK